MFINSLFMKINLKYKEKNNVNLFYEGKSRLVKNVTNERIYFNKSSTANANKPKFFISGLIFSLNFLRYIKENIHSSISIRECSQSFVICRIDSQLDGWCQGILKKKKNRSSLLTWSGFTFKYFVDNELARGSLAAEYWDIYRTSSHYF